jgi:hypothetical protein
MAKDKKDKKNKSGKENKGEKKIDIGEVTLKGVIASYPHYYKKHAANSTATPKYAGDFIIDPSTKSGKANIKLIEAAIAAVEIDKFGKKDPRYKEGRKAYHEGNDIVSQKTDETPPELVDMMVIKAKNDRRPTLVNRRGETATEDDDLFFGGTIVNPILRFYGIEADNADKGGRGLFCSLEGVQYVEEGERFGAAPLSEDRFKNIDNDADDDDDDDGEEFKDPTSKKPKKDKGKKSKGDDAADKGKKSKGDDAADDKAEKKKKKKALLS